MAHRERTQKETYGQKEAVFGIVLDVKTGDDYVICFSTSYHALGQSALLDLEDVEALIKQLTEWLDRQ